MIQIWLRCSTKSYIGIWYRRRTTWIECATQSLNRMQYGYMNISRHATTVQSLQERQSVAMTQICEHCVTPAYTCSNLPAVAIVKDVRQYPSDRMACLLGQAIDALGPILSTLRRQTERDLRSSGSANGIDKKMRTLLKAELEDAIKPSTKEYQVAVKSTQVLPHIYRTSSRETTSSCCPCGRQANCKRKQLHVIMPVKRRASHSTDRGLDALRTSNAVRSW